MKKEEIKTESEREGRKDVKPKKKQGEKRKGDRDGRLERRRWGGGGGWGVRDGAQSCHFTTGEMNDFLPLDTGP